MILAVIFLSLIFVAHRCLYLLGTRDIPQRTGSEPPHQFRHLVGDLGKPRPHRGGHIEHLDPFRLDAGLFKQRLGVIDPLFGFEISFQEMTLAFQSPGDEHGVGTILKRFEDIEAVNFPRAQESNDPHER